MLKSPQPSDHLPKGEIDNRFIGQWANCGIRDFYLYLGPHRRYVEWCIKHQRSAY